MKKGKWSVRWRSVLLGTGVGVLILVCGCAAASGLMAKGMVDLAHTDLFAAGILAASALGGCMTALPGGGWIDAVLTAVGELVVLLALNAGLHGGEMEGVAATILVLAGGCGGALLLASGRSSGRKTRKPRRKNREYA